MDVFDVAGHVGLLPGSGGWGSPPQYRQREAARAMQQSGGDYGGKGDGVDLKTDKRPVPLMMRMTKKERKDLSKHIHRAIKRGDIIAIRRVIEGGFDPNERLYIDSTALDLAALHGRTSIAELLLVSGAFANGVYSDDSAPLAGAVLQGHCATIRLLLEHGASVKISPMGVSLLTYASWGGGRLKTSRHFDMLRAAGAS